MLANSILKVTSFRNYHVLSELCCFSNSNEIKVCLQIKLNSESYLIQNVTYFMKKEELIQTSCGSHGSTMASLFSWQPGGHVIEWNLWQGFVQWPDLLPCWPSLKWVPRKFLGGKGNRGAMVAYWLADLSVIQATLFRSWFSFSVGLNLKQK